MIFEQILNDIFRDQHLVEIIFVMQIGKNIVQKWFGFIPVLFVGINFFWVFFLVVSHHFLTGTVRVHFQREQIGWQKPTISKKNLIQGCYNIRLTDILYPDACYNRNLQWLLIISTQSTPRDHKVITVFWLLGPTTLKSLIEEHAGLDFSDFLSTLFAIFHVINEKFHPARLLIYLLKKQAGWIFFQTCSFIPVCSSIRDFRVDTNKNNNRSDYVRLKIGTCNEVSAFQAKSYSNWIHIILDQTNIVRSSSVSLVCQKSF